MKKKITLALIILATALMLAFSPSPASAEECPDIYVQPAVCNTDNPPTKLVGLTEIPKTGSDFYWTAWIVGGILLFGTGIVALNIAARKWDRADRVPTETEEGEE